MKKLDSKSQKCVFIRYGVDEYGHRLWDYEHNKIIKSRDVIFDESQLYKHRLQEHGIEKDIREYMELDEPKDGQIPRIENPKVFDEATDTEMGAGDQQQVPETPNLRRSNRKDLYVSLVGEKPEAMNANERAILDIKVLATTRLSLTP
ncbi:hypothetical protein RJ640_015701 [Escallonia rubra]|uniref:Retroviral polymerase SH3-like domain-containing protein n=1 Tax=Escallonia rubra TaxID=112253 RepID=A0AA88QX27_9ASTE|nr:hypothetical protein RJ640_015701 [Escallonia rubra]